MSRGTTAPTPPGPADPGQTGGTPLKLRLGVVSGDLALGLLCRGAAALVLLMLVALVGLLGHAALPSLRAFGADYFTSAEWRPNELTRPLRGPDGRVVVVDGERQTETLPPRFGALPVIYGTVATSLIALVFAVPLSLGAALFLVRVAPRWRAAAPVAFLIEFLAAIPSLAYGMWGAFVLVPFLGRHVEPLVFRALGDVTWLKFLFYRDNPVTGQSIRIPLEGRDMMAGGLILAIMILPIVTAVARDVLRAVPRSQIEGSLALGATWWQSSRAMLRYGRAGLFGAVMLGLARAAGETMAVTLVVGNRVEIVPSPFASIQTMASLLANQFNDPVTEVHRSALIGVALILLVISLLFNIVARSLVVGGQSRTALSD
ncbi:MAG: phosphate ABC transporter permease subunit PstC [Phycisphaerales bacterium]|nr:phosphate ABC transporter permease subunit PstC [Phycisphaerales bacterium]